LLSRGEEELGFDPKLIRLPFRPLVLPFRVKISWALSHLLYFPALCTACFLSLLYGRPLALLLRPRGGPLPYVCSREFSSRKGRETLHSKAMKSNGNYVEISGYSFIGWGVVAVDDGTVIRHEFGHVEAWLGDYSPHKLAFNLVPLMVAGIFVTPFVGLGPISLALSLALVLTFSLMAFVKMFH
jgi:hypothetical protein